MDGRSHAAPSMRGAIHTRPKVAYLSLQTTREGQAAHAHVLEIVKGLTRQGWDVALYTPSYASQDGVPPFRRALEFIRVQYRLWSEARPGLLYVRWHFASWPSVVLGKLLKIPVIIEVNGPYEDLFLAWPWTKRVAWLFVWLLRSQLQLAAAVVTVTEPLGQWVREQVERDSLRYVIIPNGVDTELFHPLAPVAASLAIDTDYVIFVGALARWQGIQTMIRAVSDTNWPEGVRLVVVGDGPCRNEIEQAAAATNRILYLGTQPYRCVPGLIAHSLASLCPKMGPYSDTGLLPVKLFEGLACGVPVIVSDYPGMADLVRSSECGIVIPPNDPQALAAAVAHLFNNPQVRREMGARGRALVEGQHSWDHRAQDTGRLFMELLDKRT